MLEIRNTQWLDFMMDEIFMMDFRDGGDLFGSELSAFVSSPGLAQLYQLNGFYLLLHKIRMSWGIMKYGRLSMTGGGGLADSLRMAICKYRGFRVEWCARCYDIVKRDLMLFVALIINKRETNRRANVSNERIRPMEQRGNTAGKSSSKC